MQNYTSKILHFRFNNEQEGFWFPGQIYEISNGGLIIFNILNLGLKNKISTKNEFSTRQFLF